MCDNGIKEFSSGSCFLLLILQDADMVHNMPGVPYEKQDMVDGMVRMFNMGYQMGKDENK